MAEHVILGAGSIGTNVARLLAERGESVLMDTRSGSGPEHPLIGRVAADASDASQLTDLSRGAKVIYHAANPPSYTMWERLLPPLQTAAIAAAKANDAVLALTASLYSYGVQPGGRMNEHTPMAAPGTKGACAGGCGNRLRPPTSVHSRSVARTTSARTPPVSTPRSSARLWRRAAQPGFRGT